MEKEEYEKILKKQQENELKYLSYKEIAQEIITKRKDDDEENKKKRKKKEKEIDDDKDYENDNVQKEVKEKSKKKHKKKVSLIIYTCLYLFNREKNLLKKKMMIMKKIS